ncbi:hypothetical protein KI387_033031, partial [Taxus chinensis]
NNIVGQPACWKRSKERPLLYYNMPATCAWEFVSRPHQVQNYIEDEEKVVAAIKADS